MKRLFLLIFLFSVLNSQSQDLNYVSLSGGTTLAYYGFKTDQQVIIKITPEGRVTEWGTEYQTQRYNYQPGKLEQYMGRVDYYGPEADSISRGKVKSIGTCILTYYGAYEIPAKRGKLKSIGHNIVDYYTEYENAAFRGKVSSIGASLFTYYASYDNEALQGKLKSVNNIQLTYYSTFDDKIVQGKIKSIGSSNYVWYTSNDQYRGALKSGAIKQTIAGVNYLIM